MIYYLLLAVGINNSTNIQVDISTKIYKEKHICTASALGLISKYVNKYDKFTAECQEKIVEVKK